MTRLISLAAIILVCAGTLSAQQWTLRSDFLVGAVKFYGKDGGNIGLEIARNMAVGVRYARHDSTGSYAFAPALHISLGGSTEGAFNVGFSAGVAFLNGLLRFGGGYDLGGLVEKRNSRLFGYVGTNVPF